MAEKYNMKGIQRILTSLNLSDFKLLCGPSDYTKCIEAYFGTAESFTSGSLISSRSLQRPVKTTESVSIGLNLIRAEGTKSSSSSVLAVCPASGK